MLNFNTTDCTNQSIQSGADQSACGNGRCGGFVGRPGRLDPVEVLYFGTETGTCHLYVRRNGRPIYLLSLIGRQLSVSTPEDTVMNA